MNKEIENRLKKYSKLKEEWLIYLKKIAEQKSVGIEIIEDAINKIKTSKPQYLEGYELRIANEKKVPLKKENDNRKVKRSFYYQDSTPEMKENIKIDIILKNKEKEIKIGNVNCDISMFWEIFVGDLKRYEVLIKDITIYDNYENKGYGTFILQHIPMIMSDLYKGEVFKVITTVNVYKFDKYKIHDTTYSERIEGIKGWLMNNGFTLNNEYIKIENEETPVYEMDLNKRKALGSILEEFKKEIKYICFNTWKWKEKTDISEGVETCKEILEELYNNKYTNGIKEVKILKLEKIKEWINKSYEEEVKYRNKIIDTIEKVKEIHDTISNEELEIKKEDSFVDITIKLYCKYFNLGKTSKELSELGYTTKNKQGKERNFTFAEIKEIINNGKTKYENLKKYAEYIVIANKKSNRY